MNELDYLDRETKHFLAYHNADGMGFAMFEDGPTNEMGFLTRKSVQNMVGNTIWVVEGIGKPKKYFFRGYFIVDEVLSDDVDDQLYHVLGKGEPIAHDVPLNNEFWFPSLKRMQGNFGFGIQALRAEYVEKFDGLLNEHVSFRPI